MAEATRWFNHPLETAGVVVEMLFPRNLADDVENLQVIEQTVQAGRPAVVIDWNGDRYWVDSETGVILRRQRFDESGKLLKDVAISSIVYDPDLPQDITDADAIEAAPFESAPTAQPGDISSAPPTSQPADFSTPPSTSQPDEATPTPLEPPTATPTPAVGDTILLSISDDQASDIISTTGNGYHILKVYAWRPEEEVPFGKAEGVARRDLEDARYEAGKKAFLEGLRKNATVTTYPENVPDVPAKGSHR